MPDYQLEILEQIFCLLGIKNVTPLGFTQQFRPSEVVQTSFATSKAAGAVGSLPRRHAFQWTLRDEWLSAKNRVCSETLLHRLRQNLSLLTSSKTLFKENTRLVHLQAITVDPTDCFRGLLGHFTPAQMNCIGGTYDGSPPLCPHLTTHSGWHS